MALDVYVMPLWRFKAGDFTSPVEQAIGMKPEVIAPSAPPEISLPWYALPLTKLGILRAAPTGSDPSFDQRRANALQEVELLKRELTKLTGVAVDWPDDGEACYNKQFYQPAVLRAIAAWHDHRDHLPEFIAAPGLDYDEHPVWKLPTPAQRRFPTLVAHRLRTGYFLPVAFEGNLRVEPFKIRERWDDFHDAASSQSVLRELADLVDFMATVPEHREQAHGSSPVGDARWYAEELLKICALSIERKLPVIFNG